MFRKSPEIINELKKESENNLFDLVECRIKPEENYNLYIFTMILPNKEELLKTWEDISSDVALYFQSDLKYDIEIWNIYILFLIQDSVDGQTRYLVEQNKYSSRKLVIENIKIPITEEYIDKLIEEKLFTLNIYQEVKGSNIDPISKIIETQSNKLFSIIKNCNEKPSVLFTKYLELLKSEL